MTKGFRLLPVNTLVDRDEASPTGAMDPHLSIDNDPCLNDYNMIPLKKDIQTAYKSEKMRLFIERKKKD